MEERKVLNKYYPPVQGDPAAEQQMKVPMMLPMSIQCATNALISIRNLYYMCFFLLVVG
jgi:hypothetical protein